MVLRVLSLNVWHDSGPWERRRELIRGEIEQLAPDLIGFQEVLQGDGVDLAGELVEGLGYETEFVHASPFWGRPDVSFGNAIATRHPIVSHDTLTLPDAGDGETRAAVSVTVAAPVGPVSFTSTHLNWKLHHGEVRERQVVALADYVRDRRPRGGFPPILVGDFNADADSTEIRYLCGLQSLGGRSVYFADAWRIAGGDEGGDTWSNRNDYARPWLEPERRLDYVFAGEPIRPSGIGQILSCRLMGDEPTADVWPSDHFGVVADLRTDPLPPPDEAPA